MRLSQGPALLGSEAGDGVKVTGVPVNTAGPCSPSPEGSSEVPLASAQGRWASSNPGSESKSHPQCFVPISWIC